MLPYRLALKWPPNDRTISDRKLCQSIPGEDASFRDIESVHDGNDIITTGTGALYIFQELAGDEVVHIAAKVGRMQGNPTLHVVKKEHVD